MDVQLPSDLAPEARAQIVAREKAYSQRLQRAGKWPQLWWTTPLAAHPSKI